MNLSVRQLQTFREVMRTGSISEASRVLGRTQPAVSAMVAGLERELGFRLFLREHGRLTPRPEAHYFLEEAEAVLERLARSAQVMGEISKLERGRLRIATMPAASGAFLPRMVSEFLADKPGLRVSLMMRSSAVVQELVASQEYDLGLGETPPPRRSIARTDFDLECLLALPAGDPLAARPVLGPRDLHGAALATLFDGHETWEQTRAAFGAAGCGLERRFVLQTFLPALHLVESALCYCLCDMITAWGYRMLRAEGGALVFRRFAPRVSSRVSLMMPAHRPPSLVAQGFRDLCARGLAEMEATMLAGAAARGSD